MRDDAEDEKDWLLARTLPMELARARAQQLKDHLATAGFAQVDLVYKALQDQWRLTMRATNVRPSPSAEEVEQTLRRIAQTMGCQTAVVAVVLNGEIAANFRLDVSRTSVR